MKSYSQRLKEAPVEVLKRMIAQQKADIKLRERDLEYMEEALRLKEPTND